MTNNITRGIEAPDYDDLLGAELWNEILPNLWQGGTDDYDVIGNSTYAQPFVKNVAYITREDFDTVVTMYQYANPVDWLVKEYRYCVYDAGIELLDKRELFATARFAYDEWKSGKRVLIRCQAGLNRSGLVMALVLMLDGWTAEDAIDIIRKRRNPYALFNKDFVRFLSNLNPSDIKKK